jgi:S-formylglutathione hydrolase FrmB
MPLLHCDFFSESLGLNTAMDVILPQRQLAAMRAGPRGKLPSLYLLHGLSDDHTAWQRWTSIERYVEGMNLAVVLPEVHRSFYTDMVRGGRYWTFVSEELPALARDLFPLSAQREDNFVAGLSMGGYGALKLALTHPERYAAVASCSGVTDIAATANEREEEGWEEYMKSIFGRLDRLPGSRNDLFFLAQQAARSVLRPKLFLCCGTEDDLLDDNRRFRDHLRQLSFSLTYKEGRGAHDWIYWDAMIQKVLAWLPVR